MGKVECKHTVEDVYIREPMVLDVMACGIASFVLESGNIDIDFAAKFGMVDEDGLKIKSLTVYAVNDWVLCTLIVRITHPSWKQCKKKAADKS